MAEKFLKLIRSDFLLWLMRNHPWAYLLLNLIALRSCRTLPNNDGLKIGEAFIGDHESIGATRGQYRHALKILQQQATIEIIETCRNREKTTTGTTTIGTKVKLLNSRVWDINFDDSNHRNNQPTTTEQPPNNHEEERLITVKTKIEDKEYAQTAKRLRTKNVLSFDFEKSDFVGITEKDLAAWKIMYPHIDLTVEILRAAQWLKNNPSKSHKKNWGRYLTGWFQRTNDTVENKKAYRSAASGQAPENVSHAEKLCQEFPEHKNGRGWRCYLHTDKKKISEGLFSRAKVPT